MTIDIRDLLRGRSLAIVEQEDDEEPAAAPVISIDADVSRDAERDALLARLREAQDVDAEQAVLRDIRRHAEAIDGLARKCLREQVITILRDHGRLSPASIADAALGESAPPKTPSSIVRAIEPWDTAVDGAGLLDDLAVVYQRYVVLPAGAAYALALWTVHTYVYDRHMITPRLALTSPEKRCGKTILLSLLTEMCARPLSTANVTAAVIYRVIERDHPTLLIDEADTFLPKAEDIRGIVNAGHRRGGVVLRCEGDDHEPRAYDCYAPCGTRRDRPHPGHDHRSLHRHPDAPAHAG